MTVLTFHPQRQGSVRFVILGARLRPPVTDSARGEVLQAQSEAFSWAVARREKSHLASELGAVPEDLMASEAIASGLAAVHSRDL